MSRLIANKIIIPEGVEVNFANGVLVVKGPKGELKRTIRDEIEIAIVDKTIDVVKKANSKLTSILVGTYASHVKNMIKGVTDGFKKVLKIEGVGYRADMQGTDLQLKVGFSHPVVMKVPAGLSVAVSKDNEISIEGFDKELVGSFAASTRDVKKPEPYKGKGIRYIDEVVRRKQGKKS